MLFKNLRTVNRVAAIQYIYCYHITKLDLSQLAGTLVNLYSGKDSDEELFRYRLQVDHFDILIQNYLQNSEKINQIISSNLKENWNIKKLHLTLLAIISVGITELLFVSGVPFQVIISQYTDIASTMLNSNEVGFVNSILQKVYNNKDALLF